MSAEPLLLRPPQRFAHALKRHGVEYLFGQSNPPALTMAAEDLGIHQIGYRQENSGSYMADGYARATGKVPVVTAQNGPAATLLVPGLAECLSASIALVALVQDVGPVHSGPQCLSGIGSIAVVPGRRQVDPTGHHR